MLPSTELISVLVILIAGIVNAQKNAIEQQRLEEVHKKYQDLSYNVGLGYEMIIDNKSNQVLNFKESGIPSAPFRFEDNIISISIRLFF